MGMKNGKRETHVLVEMAMPSPPPFKMCRTTHTVLARNGTLAG
jgi:hypothetical protein